MENAGKWADRLAEAQFRLAPDGRRLGPFARMPLFNQQRLAATDTGDRVYEIL